MGWFQKVVFSAGVGLALFGIALHTSHRSQNEVQQRDAQSQQQQQQQQASGSPSRHGGAVPHDFGGADSGLKAAEEGSGVIPSAEKRRSACETSSLLGS